MVKILLQLVIGQLIKLCTIIFTNRLFSRKTKSKLQLLSHQGLQRTFGQNRFTGVLKCPLLSDNSKLVEFQSHKQKPWVSKLWFCYCLFSGVWTLSNPSVLSIKISILHSRRKSPSKWDSVAQIYPNLVYGKMGDQTKTDLLKHNVIVTSLRLFPTFLLMLLLVTNK